MAAKQERETIQIEDAQAALRESIEATKVLAQKADRLLQRHKVRSSAPGGEDAR